MLLVAKALQGFEIAALDRSIGVVSDFLFDDKTWKFRWMVVDTGGWWDDHKVLLQPSVVTRIDYAKRVVFVSLLSEKIRTSPDLMQDPPVSRQMEARIFDHYGWNPGWGGDRYYLDSELLLPAGGDFLMDPVLERELAGFGDGSDEGDPHLRSAKIVTGSHIHAKDGEIGHIENFLVDDDSWGVRYLIVDTSNWWFGRHVLISPLAVRAIDWPANKVDLDVTKAQVQSSPVWDPLTAVDRLYEQQLHRHYGWRGYGW
jgi:hypothetical protein